MLRSGCKPAVFENLQGTGLGRGFGHGGREENRGSAVAAPGPNPPGIVAEIPTDCESEDSQSIVWLKAAHAVSSVGDGLNLGN